MKLHSKRWLDEEINKSSFSKEFLKLNFWFPSFNILINTRKAIIYSIYNFILVITKIHFQIINFNILSFFCVLYHLSRNYECKSIYANITRSAMIKLQVLRTFKLASLAFKKIFVWVYSIKICIIQKPIVIRIKVREYRLK